MKNVLRSSLLLLVASTLTAALTSITGTVTQAGISASCTLTFEPTSVVGSSTVFSVVAGSTSGLSLTTGVVYRLDQVCNGVVSKWYNLTVTGSTMDYYVLIATGTLSPSTGVSVIACVGNPGNTTGVYRQQCQTGATPPLVYICGNSSGCTVAADWYLVGGSGSPYTSPLFTSQTAVTVLGSAHGFTTAALVVSAYDNSTPRNLIAPSAITVNASNFNVVVTFASSSTGYIVVNGGVGATGATGGIGPGGTISSIQANGVAQTSRSTLNLISGANSVLACADNLSNNSTDCGVNFPAPGAKVQLKQFALVAPQASVSFSGFIPTSGYSRLEMEMSVQSPGSSTDTLLAQLNADMTAANYPTTLNYGVGGAVTSVGATGFWVAYIASASPFGGHAWTTSELSIMNFLGTTNYKSWSTRPNTWANGGTAIGTEWNSGMWLSAAAITNITFTFSSGLSFPAGCVFTLYGIV